jgi:hypothetical protein
VLRVPIIGTGGGLIVLNDVNDGFCRSCALAGPRAALPRLPEPARGGLPRGDRSHLVDGCPDSVSGTHESTELVGRGGERGGGDRMVDVGGEPVRDQAVSVDGCQRHSEVVHATAPERLIGDERTHHLRRRAATAAATVPAPP